MASNSEEIFGLYPAERLLWDIPPGTPAANVSWAWIQARAAYELQKVCGPLGLNPGDVLADRLGGSGDHHRNKLRGRALASGPDVINWLLISGELHAWPGPGTRDDFLPDSVQVPLPALVDRAADARLKRRRRGSW